MKKVATHSSKIKRHKASKKKSYRIVAGLDMGPKNTAATILRGTISSKSGKLIGLKHISSQMMDTINDLTQDKFCDDHAAFIKSFHAFLDKYKPNEVMAERFISRGLKGSMGEKVAAMLFTMATICWYRDIKFTLVAAQAWKNTFNKRHFYASKLNELYLLVGKTKNSHRVDSFLIACFALGAFEYLKNKNRVDSLILKVKP